MSEGLSGSTRSSLLLGLALILPVVAVIVAVVLLGGQPYRALDRGVPGIETSMTSAVLHLVVAVAGTVCIGGLFYGAFIRTRLGPRRLSADPSTDFGVVRWAAIVWASAAVALIPVDAADANGEPLSKLLDPGALPYLVQASYLPAAWIVVALLVGFVFVAAVFATSWQSLAGLLVPAIVALLAPLLVTQVLVGPNHDFGSDATILGAPAQAIWFGATVVMALRVWRGPRPSPAAVGRFRLAWATCWLVTSASGVVVMMFELAGSSPLASRTGMLMLVQFGLLLVLALCALPSVARWGRPDSASLLVRAAPLTVGLFVMAAYVGIDVIRSRIPPPQYFVPTSIMQLFFGYNANATPTPLALAFDWRPNILFLVMAAVGCTAYLFGVTRLRRRGDVWPIGRTVAWLAGWIVIVLTTSSGIGRYSNAAFSIHMVLHMCLNMIGPLLLVLGGAVTLALRATTAHPERRYAGPHEWVTGLLNWRFSRGLYNPLFVFVRFIGSYYLLYLTGLFAQALRYHWAHQVMNVEFLVVGYMFYGLVIGVDHTPRPLPHIGKLGLVLAAMPFHAFFGVVVMMSSTVIAKEFYQYIDAPWMHDLHADQYLGGGIAWAAGEIPLLFVVIVLVTQWARQDERQARRTDRTIDKGLDDSFSAYNEMLSRLAQREDQAPRAAQAAANTAPVTEERR
ncbi:cytochrome c oxidase assembly protein [Humibacter ginsenosidimutans]|uniref:Cytochrome c oxidase assembly protein n=1 Tax=Humibacter ginsenosidimutans TaxID=2599293 RepID=A0A5B8M0W9_9MICO|nr:cytochrome c oxidase assembly protein [Humibacter ginsenosidimutans]QDZ13574.1 cytochrome c oxidase assembly protein [Humibacter ginsenosidimutans]